jgi:hypothetical protein
MIEWLALLLQVQEVLVSSHGPESIMTDIFVVPVKSLQENVRIVP